MRTNKYANKIFKSPKGREEHPKVNPNKHKQEISTNQEGKDKSTDILYKINYSKKPQKQVGHPNTKCLVASSYIGIKKKLKKKKGNFGKKQQVQAWGASSSSLFA